MGLCALVTVDQSLLAPYFATLSLTWSNQISLSLSLLSRRQIRTPELKSTGRSSNVALELRNYDSAPGCGGTALCSPHWGVGARVHRREVRRKRKCLLRPWRKRGNLLFCPWPQRVLPWRLFYSVNFAFFMFFISSPDSVCVEFSRKILFFACFSCCLLDCGGFSMNASNQCALWRSMLVIDLYLIFLDVDYCYR